MRVLVIEDDSQVSALLGDTLRSGGHQPVLVDSGEQALLRLGQETFDAAILDLLLPGLDGLSVLRRLRAAGLRLPVLILTARDATSDRVAGLDLGADDYLVKPFDHAELLARLRAITRRHPDARATRFTLADLHVDLATREVTRAGQRIDLTVREFAVLECLLRADGAVVTRTELLQRVWRFQFDPGTNLVEVAIRRLRRKLDEGRSPALLQTVRGLGYALQVQP
ncbi:MAG: response regulator transcription factor [Opitutaceae bacterium]|jgi:DNA-binding response OmpR family regulator|nr:response regulator transcription factor [Opitutaceae bacterium]